MDLTGLRRITPSQPDFWRGTPVDGSSWTAEQTATLKRERPAWHSFDRHEVKLYQEPRSLREPPPAPVVVHCPIIARTKDRGSVLIVTPSGDLKWVAARVSRIGPC